MDRNNNSHVNQLSLKISSSSANHIVRKHRHLAVAELFPSFNKELQSFASEVFTHSKKTNTCTNLISSASKTVCKTNSSAYLLTEKSYTSQGQPALQPPRTGNSQYAWIVYGRSVTHFRHLEMWETTKCRFSSGETSQ